MSKKVTSVSIDEDLAERLSEDEHVNASGLFNSFLREYYAGGSTDGIEFRLMQVEHELEEARAEVARLEDRRDELQELAEERRGERSEELAEKVEVLSTISENSLTPDNPAVVNQAADVAVTPAELAQIVREAD